MENITWHLADAADIEALIEMRLRFIIELAGEPEADAGRQLRAALAQYFSEELGRTYFCWMAKVSSVPIAVAGMAISRRPSGLSNPSGWWGYIMNVYTEPSFRRQGLSTALMVRLMQTAKEKGIVSLELHATAQGEPIYTNLGFKRHTEPSLRLMLS